MKQFILDACAVIAFLYDEEGAEVLEDLLLQARNGKVKLFMHALNLGEVYYDILKRNDESIARQTYSTLKKLPIKIIRRINDQLLYQASILKSQQRISLADSYAVAETIIRQGTLVTTDHHEFNTLEKDKIIKILWLR